MLISDEDIIVEYENMLLFSTADNWEQSLCIELFTDGVTFYEHGLDPAHVGGISAGLWNVD